jgi:hypothetical protein
MMVDYFNNLNGASKGFAAVDAKIEEFCFKHSL